MPFKADFDLPGHVKPALQHGKKILESAHLLGNWRNRGRLLHGAGLMSLLDSVFLDSSLLHFGRGLHNGSRRTSIIRGSRGLRKRSSFTSST
jgi:hypothetical protein